MCGFRSLNSGDERYLLNSDSQSSAFIGGSDPVTGRHSVILSLQGCQFRPGHFLERTYPDSVSLVNPPNTTIPNTLTALPKSQYATLFELTSGKLDVALEEVLCSTVAATVDSRLGLSDDAKILAFFTGRIELTLLLLESGRDVKKRARKGFVALRWFCKHCRQVKKSFATRGARLLNIGTGVLKDAIATITGHSLESPLDETDCQFKES